MKAKSKSAAKSAAKAGIAKSAWKAEVPVCGTCQAKVRKKDITGRISGFPIDVVERMLELQEEQQGFRDLSVFRDEPTAMRDFGGFDYNKTKEGNDFWMNVVDRRNFKRFFAEYPGKKRPKPTYKYVYVPGYTGGKPDGPAAVSTLAGLRGFSAITPSARLFMMDYVAYIPYGGGVIEYAIAATPVGKYVMEHGRKVMPRKRAAKSSVPLDDEEREYLKGVLRPFRRLATAVTVVPDKSRKGMECLVVCTSSSRAKWRHGDSLRGFERMTFPSFPEGLMYKGLSREEAYDLKELGL